jgi:hypothetical protein
MLPCSFCCKQYTQNYKQYSTRIGKVLNVIKMLIPRIFAIAQMILTMRLCHPPDGSTSPKYKLLFFIATKNFLQREERTSF